MITCSVIGAKGYTGCEIIKLLAQHPQVEIVCLADKDEMPQPAMELISSLSNRTDLVIQKWDIDVLAQKSDVIYLALPHTKSVLFAKALEKTGKLVIDLSADFRLKDTAVYEKWYKETHAAPALIEKAVYGLPELYRNEIKSTKLIANPGCFPTGSMLPLIPLLKKKLIKTESIIIDAKTGVSGAGRNPSAANHFCEVYENFKAYKVNQHQHIPEIEQILSEAAGTNVKIAFVPHLLPILRGILSTIYVEKKESVSGDAIYAAISDAYQDEPFVRVKPRGVFPQTKEVEDTNYCDIGVWAQTDSPRVILMSTIDNLIKGASGQAVQNMNICCGIDEKTGLV